MMKRLTKITYTLIFLLYASISFAAIAVIDQSATPIANTTATLNGLANPDSRYATIYFQYGTDPTLAGIPETYAGTVSGTIEYKTLNLTGLQKNTTYYWRALVRAGSDVAYGSIVSFTTRNTGFELAPSVTNLSVVGTTSGTSTLSSDVLANGANTTVTFQYALTDSDLQTSPSQLLSTPVPSTLATSANRQVSLTNLAPNTTYSWRVKVQNSAGTAFSNISTFTTLQNNLAPVISDVSFSDNNGSSVKILYRVLNGTFTSRILYGTTSGALTSFINATSGNADLSTDATITGLTANTRYYYQVEVTNNISTVLSPEAFFTPPTPNAPNVVAKFDFDNTKTSTNGSLTFINDDNGAGANTFTVGRNLAPNGALQFANNRVKVVIPSLPVAKTARTISIWAKIDSYVSDNYNFIFGYGAGSNLKAYGVGIYKTAAGVHTVRNYAYADEIEGTPNPFDQFAWHHYVTTYDGTTANLYVDGFLTRTTPKTTWDASRNIFFIGGNSYDGSNFTGAIDDLTIFNRVLTPQEVTTLFNNNTLPVSLISYTAKAQNNNAVLNWKTASETNNSHFVVEKSTDGTNFSEIAIVNAKSANGADYTYTDYNTNSGTNYYRLTQVDLDGKTTNLGVKAVKMSIVDAEVKLYPNPATDYVSLSFEAGVYTQAILVDINGKVLNSLAIVKVQNTATIYLSKVTPGTYLVQLVGANSKTIKKVIKR